MTNIYIFILDFFLVQIMAVCDCIYIYIFVLYYYYYYCCYYCYFGQCLMIES